MAKNQKGGGPFGELQKKPVDYLVCFAVKEEAKFFLPGPNVRCQVWITGMGRPNATEGIRRALELVQPRQVITAGFAGGLNPAIKFGTVLFDQDAEMAFPGKPDELGARQGTFHCHRRVATTVSEKAELWKLTGADAVEMESSVIRSICRQQGIPAATIRVISDDAEQDLPLDFNALMTPDDRIDYAKLAWTVASHPWRIGRLIQFQAQTVTAARALGELLRQLLGAAGDGGGRAVLA